MDSLAEREVLYYITQKHCPEQLQTAGGGREGIGLDVVQEDRVVN